MKIFGSEKCFSYQKEISFLVVSGAGRYFDDFSLLQNLPGGWDEIDAASNGLLDLQQFLELFNSLHRVVGVSGSLAHLLQGACNVINCHYKEEMVMSIARHRSSSLVVAHDTDIVILEEIIYYKYLRSTVWHRMAEAWSWGRCFLSQARKWTVVHYRLGVKVRVLRRPSRIKTRIILLNLYVLMDI